MQARDFDRWEETNGSGIVSIVSLSTIIEEKRGNSDHAT